MNSLKKYSRLNFDKSQDNETEFIDVYLQKLYQKKPYLKFSAFIQKLHCVKIMHKTKLFCATLNACIVYIVHSPYFHPLSLAVQYSLYWSKVSTPRFYGCDCNRLVVTG